MDSRDTGNILIIYQRGDSVTTSSDWQWHLKLGISKYAFLMMPMGVMLPRKYRNCFLLYLDENVYPLQSDHHSQISRHRNGFFPIHCCIAIKKDNACQFSRVCNQNWLWGISKTQTLDETSIFFSHWLLAFTKRKFDSSSFLKYMLILM